MREGEGERGMTDRQIEREIDREKETKTDKQTEEKRGRHRGHEYQVKSNRFLSTNVSPCSSVNKHIKIITRSTCILANQPLLVSLQ